MRLFFHPPLVVKVVCELAVLALALAVVGLGGGGVYFLVDRVVVSLPFSARVCLLLQVFVFGGSRLSPPQVLHLR